MGTINWLFFDIWSWTCAVERMGRPIRGRSSISGTHGFVGVSEATRVPDGELSICLFI